MDQDYEANLIACAQKGDREALGTLFSRVDSALRSFVRARVRPAEREDIVQDTVMRATQKIEQLNGPFWPWLRTICRNRIMDHYRSSRPTAVLPDDPLAALRAVTDQGDDPLAARN